MGRWITRGMVVAGIALFMVFLVFLHEPTAKHGENGTFSNDCCGTVKLSDGKMLLNEQQTIRYTVAKDLNGPYILPRTDVGTIPDQGFDVDGTRSVRKLRLDRLPAPTKITLYEGLRPYVFARQAPRIRR